jgi:hypothetical protein
MRAERKESKVQVVLNIGISQSYLSRREEILRTAGFAVVNATVEGTLVMIAEYDVCLAIFGHLVHPSDRVKLSDTLRRRNPNVRIVVMYDYSVRKTESADAVLQINVPPADLIHTVEYLLSGGNSTAATSS